MKVEWLTFDVGKCHVEFNFFKDRIVYHDSFVSDEVPVSHKIKMHDVWYYTDPSMVD